MSLAIQDQSFSAVGSAGASGTMEENVFRTDLRSIFAAVERERFPEISHSRSPTGFFGILPRMAMCRL